MNEHAFWLVSRASGTVALVLSSLAVCAGLLMTRHRDLRAAHEALSLGTLLALAIHGVSLLGDSFLAPSVWDLVVPFVSDYQRGWTTTGILAGWGLAFLALTYYWRGRIGVARWKRLHRWVAIAWVLGVVHSFGEGTDAGSTWFVVLGGLPVLAAVVLLILRHLPEEPVGSEA